MFIENLKLKTKRNANIFLAKTCDGEFLLHSDMIVKFNISCGEVDELNFNLAVKESEKIIAFDLVTKYLANKNKTKRQVKEYLTKKEISSEIIPEVIEKCEQYHLVDDKMYASSYIKSNKNFSKLKLKQKLAQSGVKSEIISDNLENFDEEESCELNAKKFLRNKVITKEVIEKLTRRLGYMGYSWQTIKHILDKLKIEFEDIE